MIISHTAFHYSLTFFENELRLTLYSGIVQSACISALCDIKKTTGDINSKSHNVGTSFTSMKNAVNMSKITRIVA